MRRSPRRADAERERERDQVVVRCSVVWRWSCAGVYMGVCSLTRVSAGATCARKTHGPDKERLGIIMRIYAAARTHTHTHEH